MDIDDRRDIKTLFHIHFDQLMRSDKRIMHLFYEIFVYGPAYIVGGYFRDFLFGKESRDVDVIVDIPQILLLELVHQSGNHFDVNRHGGIKIGFDSIYLDIWSIQDNWAFKNNLVKLNEEDKLNSIAKGCFYNYDALVINVLDFSYNLRYYNEFRSSNQLDILQTRSSYKNLNPTIEANILRAFYIKFRFGSTYTDNTYRYLFSKTGYLNDRHEKNIADRLIEIREKYSKYNVLTDEIILEYLQDLKEKDNPTTEDQFRLDL